MENIALFSIFFVRNKSLNLLKFKYTGDGNMEIKYITNNNVFTAKLYGELDECSAEYVRMSLDKLLGDLNFVKDAKVVLDFSHVSFMDSTGIGVLLGRYKKFIKRNINIEIANPPAHVDKILKMSGIYSLMPLI